MTPSQCRAGRALIRISQAELAARAGVCRKTVIIFEATGRNMLQGHVNAVRAALTAAGVEMIDGDRPGVRAPADSGARH